MRELRYRRQVRRTVISVPAEENIVFVHFCRNTVGGGWPVFGRNILRISRLPTVIRLNINNL